METGLQTDAGKDKLSHPTHQTLVMVTYILGIDAARAGIGLSAHIRSGDSLACVAMWYDD